MPMVASIIIATMSYTNCGDSIMIIGPGLTPWISIGPSAPPPAPSPESAASAPE